MTFGQNGVRVLAKNEFFERWVVLWQKPYMLECRVGFLGCIPSFSCFAKADFGSLHCQYTIKVDAR
jgi:hypothetical protein